MRLENKVCLVTGASRGIGRAIALTFAKEGANVVVNYSKSKDQAEDVVKEITKLGRKAISIKADVSRKNEVRVMVAQTIKQFKRIDVLVNNAGISYKSTKILRETAGEWKRILGVNLIGTYYCIQSVVPYMIKQKKGKIINISSLASIGTTNIQHLAYGPSKAAVNILTKRLAYELGPYNINVNAIAPGLIRTEILGVSGTELEELLRKIASVTDLRRTGEPQDIANAALFLASDESNFMTGQVMVVDGGRFNFLSHGV
jgi:3-oxoacyl-[acyl-carrier protein] reductase